MLESFSFCGVDISSLGVRYVPEQQNTYTFNQTWQPQTQAFEGFHGALYYGETVQPKEFRLRCFFEDKNINQGVVDRILQLFSRGKTGRLVFSTRPWLWYTATAASVDTTQLLNYQNGYISIVLRCYYPFARCDYLSLDDLSAAGFDVASTALLQTSAFLHASNLPETQFGSQNIKTRFVLHNPGTEYASVAISVAGEAGSGVTITNLTTGDECKLIEFTKAITTTAGKTVVCDALNGKTVLKSSSAAEQGFIYHDHGFIRLAPCPIYQRGLVLQASDNVVSPKTEEESEPDYIFTANDVGKYLCVDGSWYKIDSVSDGSAVLDDDGHLLGEIESFETDLTDMNEIIVTAGSNSAIDQLAFTYKPTFR